MNLTVYKATGIAGAFFSSYSLLLLRWGSLNPDMGNEILGRVVSVVFWLGLILALGAEVLFCRGAARLAEKDKSERGRRYAESRRGVFTFGATPEALCCDVGCGLALLLEILVLTGLLAVGPFWEYLLIATVLFGFHMHCFLNGKNYLYTRGTGKETARHE